jgi:hypothetical protein
MIEGRRCPAIFPPPIEALMPRISKIDKLAQARNIIRGVSSRFTKGTGYQLAGKKYSPRELIALFQAHVDAIHEVEAARARFTVAVLNEKEAARRTAGMAQALRLFIAGNFGEAPEVWGAFGWDPPKKPGPKTVRAKVAGVQKRATGRAAKKKR